MAKYAFIDIETTGLDPERHGIHQISMTIVSDGTKRIYDYRVRPFDGDEIELSALETSNVTVEQILGYDPPGEVYAALRGNLGRTVSRYDRRDKLFFVGYNSTFDMNFLRQFFVKNGNMYFGSFFFWPSIDVAVLACDHLGEKRADMNNFKLMTVAEAFGIPVDHERLHDARYDIELTMAIYYTLHPGEKADYEVSVDMEPCFYTREKKDSQCVTS